MNPSFKQRHLNGSPEPRALDASMCFSFLGWNWSVSHLPGLQVGDLVDVKLGERSGAPCALVSNAVLQDTWAEPVGSVEDLRSPLHTCLQCCIRGRSGTVTSTQTTFHSGSCLYSGQRYPLPSSATESVHKHSRISSTAGGALGDGASPIWPEECAGSSERSVCHTHDIHKSKQSFFLPISGVEVPAMYAGEIRLSTCTLHLFLECEVSA